MTDQLPAIVQPGALATPTDTYIVPALIADAGNTAGWRYVEFFTANINNDHTRRAYARACNRFFGWCEHHDLTLVTIRPVHVAAWVKELQEKHGAPGVKQQLAAVRMLFDWLVIGQVVPTNPAAAVRGPKHGLCHGNERRLGRGQGPARAHAAATAFCHCAAASALKIRSVDRETRCR
jgi:hypothetical protein